MSSKTDAFRVEPRVEVDPYTERAMRFVSPPDAPSTSNYFYTQPFTPDERFFLYLCDRGDGPQVHRVEIESGETERLTHVAGGEHAFRWNLHPNGRELFYQDPPRFMALDLETLETRVVLDVRTCDWIADGTTGGSIMFSPSGKYFSFSFTHDATERHAPEGWSHWGRVAYTCSAAARAACDGSGADLVYRHTAGMQHLQFCPASDDLMSFAVWPDYQNNRDLPAAHRARAWLIDSGEARPLLTVPPGFRATHEYWSPDGERLYYHRKSVPGWVPNFLGCLDRRTGEQRDVFRHDTSRMGHSMCTPDGRFIVTDNDDFSAPNELIKVDVASGAGEVLCWRNVPADPGFADGGPTVSPRGTWTAFTTSRLGIPQVVLVRL